MGSAFGPHAGGQFPVWQNDPRPKMDNPRTNDAVVCDVNAESVAFNGRCAPWSTTGNQWSGTVKQSDTRNDERNGANIMVYRHGRNTLGSGRGRAGVHAEPMGKGCSPPTGSGTARVRHPRAVQHGQGPHKSYDDQVGDPRHFHGAAQWAVP